MNYSPIHYLLLTYVLSKCPNLSTFHINKHRSSKLRKHSTLSNILREFTIFQCYNLVNYSAAWNIPLHLKGSIIMTAGVNIIQFFHAQISRKVSFIGKHRKDFLRIKPQITPKQQRSSHVGRPKTVPWHLNCENKTGNIIIS